MKFILFIGFVFISDSRAACLSVSAECPDLQVKVTHNGCRICVNFNAPPYQNSDGTVSTSSIGFSDMSQEGDYVYKSCDVTRTTIAYLAHQAFCREQVKCRVGQNDSKEPDFESETEFRCGTSSADECQRKSWQSCLLDQTPAYKFNDCFSKQPKDFPPGSICNPPASGRVQKSNGIQ